MTDEVNELYWDSTYAVATALMEAYPQHDPQNVGLYELAALIENLPGFKDDPALATKQMLLDIQTVWYEETIDL